MATRVLHTRHVQHGQGVFVVNSGMLAYASRLFRVQHDTVNPTHELAQIDEETCVLVPLRKIYPDSEITFGYFGRELILFTHSYM